jgi:hypothetical protein
MAEPPVVAGFLGEAPVRGSVHDMYDAAWLAYQEGHHAEALVMLDRVLNFVSDYERARFARGLCLLGLNRPAGDCLKLCCCNPIVCTHTLTPSLTPPSDCPLRLSTGAEAERELAKYLSLVAHQRVNTCDALFFHAMALSNLSWEQRAIADLDNAIASKPGCSSGCACGMSCRAAEAVLARFALLFEPRVRADYARARELAASGGARQATELGEDGEAKPEAARFSFEGPLWVVPMHQLGDALDRAGSVGRIPLFVDDSSDRSVDTFFMYQNSTILEMKRFVVQLRMGEAELAAVLEEMRAKLVHAMRWGHTLVIRLGTSAPDWSKLTSERFFPVALLEHADAVPIGTNLVGHSLGGVLRQEEIQAGVFVVAHGFRVVVTSNFASDKFEGYLSGSLPSWERLQPICVVTRTTFRDGRADPLAAPETSVADKAKERQLEGDRMTLFLQS